MDRYGRRAVVIAALLLLSLFAVGAMPSPPFVLSELRSDVPDHSATFARSAMAAPLYRPASGRSILFEDQHPRWWRLTTTRAISAADAPQLVMSQPNFKELEVWRPGDQRAVRRTVYGPDSDPGHSAAAHVVPLPNGLRAGQSVYLRVKSNSTMPSEISILPLRDVYQQDNQYNRIRTIFLAVLSVVAFAAVCFSTMLRQRGYAYLAATLLAQIISLAIEGGDFRGSAILAAFAMDRRTNILLNTAAVLASVRFLMFFLNLPMNQPRIAQVLNGCSAALGAILAVSVFQVWPATAYVGNTVLLVVIGAVLTACFRAIRRRQREAYLLLLAWVPLMVVLVIRIGSLQRWWPSYDWLQFGYPGAMTFGGAGLLLALSHKMRQLSQDRDSARQRATYDGLTGVLSRSALDDAIAAAVAHAHGCGDPLCVAFVDLDRFKAINDAHGHAIGDDVLRIVAKRTRNRLRSGDLLGRYGGDELVLILPGTSQQDALRLAEQIRRAIADSPLAIDGVMIQANLSIGVAQLRQHEPVSEFLKRADGALYTSKRDGRGRVTGHGEHAEAMP